MGEHYENTKVYLSAYKVGFDFSLVSSILVMEKNSERMDVKSGDTCSWGTTNCNSLNLQCKL